MGGAPLRAVDKEHVGALRLLHAHAIKALGNVVAGPVNVCTQDLGELVHPLVSLRPVRAHERVHGEHVHVVVVALGAARSDAVSQALVVYDVVGANQAGQVEGLARRVESHRAVASIVGDALRGHVPVARQDEVAPDLVGDHHAVVLAVQLHGALDLPALPDAPARVVRRAEHGGVDVVLGELGLHVLEVHPPDAVLVDLERRVHDGEAVVLQALGEANVGRAVEKDLVAGRNKAVERGHHAAKHAVLVANVLGREAGDAVAGLLPADY